MYERMSVQHCVCNSNHMTSAMLKTNSYRIRALCNQFLMLQTWECLLHVVVTPKRFHMSHVLSATNKRYDDNAKLYIMYVAYRLF